MGYAAKKPLRTVTLPTDSQYWVKVDTDFTYGDIKTVGEDIAGSQASDKFLLLAIKEWNLDAEDGSILEISSANIDLLKKEDVLAIIEVVGQEVETPAQKKGS